MADLLPKFNDNQDSVIPMQDTRVSTFAEVQEARFKLSRLESGFLSIGTAIQAKMVAQETDLVEPDLAKELFDIEIDRPTSGRTLGVMQARQDDIKELEGIIDRGEDTWQNTGFGFVSDFAGALSDPVGFAVMVASVGGAGLVSKAISKGVTQSITKGIAFAAADAATANVIEESFTVVARKSLKDDFSAVNHLIFSAGVGAVFGGGLKASSTVLDKLFNKTPLEKLEEFNEFDAAKMVDMTDAKIKAGKDPILTETEIEISTRREQGILEERLQKALEDGDDKALNEVTEDIVNYNEKFGDEAKVKEELEASNKDMYHNDEALQRNTTIVDEDQVQHSIELEKQEFEIQRELDELSEADRLALEKQHPDPTVIDEGSLDKLLKATQFCLRG